MKILNSIKRLFFFLFLFSTFPTLMFAQDIVIKVKKGNVSLSGKSLQESSAAVVMRSAELVNVSSGALAIARQNAIIVELQSNKEYRYADILALIKKKKQTSANDFVTVAFKDPTQKANATPLKGSSTRGAGMDDKPDFFYPYDNMSVVNDTLEFFIGNSETTLSSNVVLKNIKTAAVYYDTIPENNRFELSGLPAGEYEWTYSCFYYTSIEKVETEFRNVFSVPSEKGKKEMKKRLDAAKKELKGFSSEMQKVLFLEFCIENNYYCKFD